MKLRLLSIVAMVCAPAMLLEALIPNGKENNLIVGSASLIFMIGSLCSQIALWRLGRAGAISGDESHKVFRSYW